MALQVDARIGIEADLGGLADYLNTQVNGADAEPVTTPDVDASLEALTQLAEGEGITMLEPAEAAAANSRVFAGTGAATGVAVGESDASTRRR